MKKVSVIMASYLGNITMERTNPDKKFVRAVNSFLKQTYENKELIIVADGCDLTKKIYEKMFSQLDNVNLVYIEKQELYSGECRNAGMNISTGDIVSYLDNDDVWGKKHLEIIMNEFTDDVDFVYYDDYLVMSKDFKTLQKRIVETRYGSIGTSSITHRNADWLRWQTGYGHDWTFVQTAIINGMQFKKLKEVPQYLVAHWGGEGKGDF